MKNYTEGEISPGLRYYRKNREKIALKRLALIMSGLCPQCKKDPVVSNKSGCQSCLDKASETRRTLWKKHKLTKPDKRAYLIELKGGKCKDCGYKAHPAAFEFDHLRDKKLAISNMLNQPYKWERILEEVEKCELVCANCHRIRTHNRRNNIV